MTTEVIVSCIGIFCGGFIMCVSILKAKEVLAITPFVAERNRSRVVLFVRLHRAFMVFFLFGYLIVLLAFIFKFHMVSQVFVSVIFLFGSVFVLMGVMIQVRLLSEVQSTLRGLLPICLGCKKIRDEGGDTKDVQSWKPIERYISEKADVGFSHGYCPECAEHAILLAEAEIAAEEKIR